jgi:hypothetical protein
MTIVALKNVFHDDIVRNIDAFYQRFEPEWDRVTRFEIDMEKGEREYTFYMPRPCGHGNWCFAYGYADEYEDGDSGADYVVDERAVIKVENDGLYSAVIRDEDDYRLKEGEHIFHKEQSAFPVLVKMVIEHFLEFGKGETT